MDDKAEAEPKTVLTKYYLFLIFTKGHNRPCECSSLITRPRLVGVDHHPHVTYPYPTPLLLTSGGHHWAVLDSVNFGCFVLNRCKRFQCIVMRTSIKARMNWHKI